MSITYDGAVNQTPPTRLSTVASLRRLAGYARPAIPAMVASMLMAGVATGCGLAFPLVIGAIIDGPIRHRDTASLIGWGALLLALGIGEAALFFSRRVIIARPSMVVEARMRQDLYQKLQRLPIAFHDRWPAGQLLSRAVSDLSTIRRFVSFAFIFLVVNIMTFVIGVGILVTLSWQLGLVVAALAIPLVAVTALFETRYRVLSRRTQDQVGDLATMVEESVLGIRILKAFGRSRHFSTEFRVKARELRDTELVKARVLSWLWAATIALPEVALGVALLLGIRQVADGALTAGMLVSFFGVAMTLRWPVDSIGWLLAIANETAAATERFFEVMDSPETITSPEPARWTGRGTPGHLAFRDVHFAYPDDRARPVLRGLDLTLAPGETVALVGSTGSGKTTVTSLVNRLHDVTAGRIELGGVDIRDLPLPELRSRVAVAFEDPTLFSASVRENVAIGLGSEPGSDAPVETAGRSSRRAAGRAGGGRGPRTEYDDFLAARPVDSAGPYGDGTGHSGPGGTERDAAVARALRVAQAEFVYELPHGLDTRVGEQGLSLSGGQRQRLALARAIVSRPEVLILDDPLSALDIHTEAAVEQALASVLADTTALVIAHRASTVLLADRVALMEDGRITAIGTHSELLALVPAYRSLLSSEPARADAGRTENRREA
jgi:ATP-binding cassette subfamily B protein